MGALKGGGRYKKSSTRFAGYGGPNDKWRWKSTPERLEDALTVPPKVIYRCIKCIKNEVTKEIKICKDCEGK